MRIVVDNKDYGFFSEKPITVQVIDPNEGVVWCNHDGAEEETVSFDHYNPDGQDMTHTENITYCDKCEAFKREYEDEWEDAPFEGVV